MKIFSFSCKIILVNENNYLTDDRKKPDTFGCKLIVVLSILLEVILALLEVSSIVVEWLEFIIRFTLLQAFTAKLLAETLLFYLCDME